MRKGCLQDEAVARWGSGSCQGRMLLIVVGLQCASWYIAFVHEEWSLCVCFEEPDRRACCSGIER